MYNVITTRVLSSQLRLYNTLHCLACYDYLEKNVLETKRLRSKPSSRSSIACQLKSSFGMRHNRRTLTFAYLLLFIPQFSKTLKPFVITRFNAGQTKFDNLN